jgi:hypothetical protein
MYDLKQAPLQAFVLYEVLGRNEIVILLPYQETTYHKQDYSYIRLSDLRHIPTRYCVVKSQDLFLGSNPYPVL